MLYPADIFCPTGTSDPTAASATRFGPGVVAKETPEPGEIWTNVNGMERLVLKVFPNHFVCLLLKDNSFPGCTVIHSVGTKYADTSSASTTIIRDYGHFVKKLPDDEFSAIMESWLQAMGADNVKEQTVDRMDSIVEYQGGEISRLKDELDEKTRELDDLKGKLEYAGPSTQERILQERLDSTVAQLRFMTNAYESLLDKILSRGGL